MGEYCFLKGTTLSDLETPHKLETGSALHQNVSLALANLTHNTRSAQSQAGSAQVVFC